MWRYAEKSQTIKQRLQVRSEDLQSNSSTFSKLSKDSQTFRKRKKNSTKEPTFTKFAADRNNFGYRSKTLGLLFKAKLKIDFKKKKIESGLRRPIQWFKPLDHALQTIFVFKLN